MRYRNQTEAMDHAVEAMDLRDCETNLGRRRELTIRAAGDLTAAGLFWPALGVVIAGRADGLRKRNWPGAVDWILDRWAEIDLEDLDGDRLASARSWALFQGLIFMGHANG